MNNSIEEMFLNEINELHEKVEKITDDILEIRNLKNKVKFLSEKMNLNENNSYNINAFKCFYNVLDFITYASTLYSPSCWSIFPGSYTDRVYSISKYNYYTSLKDDFNSKKLINKEVTDEQLISFLDTMSLMYLLFEKIQEEDLEIFNGISVIMEYVIPNNDKSRIDYILCYHNYMILLEFSLCSNFNNINSVKKQKQEQVKYYADELEKYLSDKVKIFTEVAIYTSDNKLYENYDNTVNGKLINDLAIRIIKTFKKAAVDSFTELLSIEK